jgi:hypothetical protein
MSFRAAVLALCLGAASAFVAPKLASAPKTVVQGYYDKFSLFPPFFEPNEEFENDFGAPSSGVWDPLGILYNADQARFDRLRYVEIKHGRIAQLAFLGHVVTSNGVRLPGNIDYSGKSFTDIGVGLNHFWEVPAVGWFQILCFIGLLEAGIMKDSANGAAPGEFPGDFRNGFIDFGWDTFDEATKIKKRTIELNNGRAAQMGILGLMVHEKLDSNALFEKVGGAYIGLDCQGLICEIGKTSF